MLQLFALHTRKTFLCVIQLLLLTAFANAQSASKVTQDFGLIGTWAVECDQTPSPKNEHAIFSLAAFDTIQLLNDFGPEYDDMVYVIVGAERIGPNRIALRQQLMTDRRVVLDVVMVKDNDKIRIWSSRSTDGTTLVRDGAIALTNGNATQWVARCKGRWAVNPDAGPN